MRKLEITIDGNSYPCRQTMGAMLRFKRETGREVTEIGSDLSDLCTYLWCCVASASKHDGVKFDMSLMDFADSVSPDDVMAWSDTTSANADGAADAEGDEKKTMA